MSTGTHSVRRTGSSALNLAWVAAGAFDVVYATRIHPWDVAAGVVLVREAGGRVSGLSGSPYDLYGYEILATNARVHLEASEALMAAWPAPGSSDPDRGNRSGASSSLAQSSALRWHGWVLHARI